MKSLYHLIVFQCFCFMAISQTSTFNNYLSFTGGDPTILNGGEFVQIPDNSFLDFDGNTSFTIQFWLKPKTFQTTAGSKQGLVTKKTGSGIGYGMFWDVTGSGNGRFQLGLKENGTSGSSSSTLSTPNVLGVNSLGWIHITAIVDRGTTPDSAFIYINGELVAEREVSSIQDLSNSNPLMLMNYNGNSSNMTAGGFIDDVRIWNTALTFRQVHRLYSEPIEEGLSSIVDGSVTGKHTTLSWSNLVAYYNMEEVGPTLSITDKSLNTNTGSYFSGTKSCVLPGCGPVFKLPSQPSYEPKPTYEAINSGGWSQSSTWKDGEIPNDDKAVVNVISGVNLALNGNYICEAFNLAGSAILTVGSGFSLDVYRYFDIDGIFDDELGKISFVGNCNHVIDGDGTINFFDFEINQISSNLEVSRPIRIVGKLTHTKGSLRTNGQITLAGTNTNTNFPQGLIDPTGDPDIIGEITFELYLSNSLKGWRQMCLPGIGILDDFNNLTLNVINGPNSALNNVSYWDNTEDNLIENTQKGWTAASSSSDQTNALSVFIDFDKFTFTNPVTFKGEYNPGDKDFTVTHFNDPGNELLEIDLDSINGVGWNFIPNNYPSLLDATLMVAENSLTYKFIHIWDAKTQQYRAFADVPANINPNNNTGTGAHTSAQSIIPFQGFWVNASASEHEATFTLKNSWRHTNFTKSPFYSLKNLQEIVFHVYSENDSSWDGTAIVFDNGYSNGFSISEDVLKVVSPSNVPTLFTSADGRSLYLNKSQLAHQEIPLGFIAQKSNGHGMYHISLENRITELGWHVYLKDNHTGTVSDISKSSYSFKATGNDLRRFTIVTSQGRVQTTERDFFVNYRNQVLTITNTTDNKNAVVIIHDVSGREIWKKQLYLEQSNEIPLNLISGIYIVMIQTAQESISQKIYIGH